MGDKEWEEEDLKMFTRLVDKTKKTWKPTNKILKVKIYALNKIKKKVEG